MEQAEVRLALRVEEPMWNAYIAKPGTMKDAILLASIRLTAAKDPKCKDLFMQFVQQLFFRMAENVGVHYDGVEVTRASEHERGGGVN